MIEVSVLVDKLNGMDVDEIRSFMGTQHVLGNPQDEHACVLANWIRRESGVDVAVGVHQDYKEHDLCHVGIMDGADGYTDFLEMSPAAIRFIKAFDEEKYPELIFQCEEYE